MAKDDVLHELAYWLDAEDPRTIADMVEQDRYDDVTIEKVERPSGGYEHWTLSWDGGITSGFKFPEGVEPEEGDTLRLYGGAGLGSTRHGYALNGRLIEWKTPFERIADRVTWLANYDRDKRERFERERAELDAKYEALSPPMKARIDRFRSKRADFRIDAEAYELMPCIDGEKIAEALRPRVEAGEDPEKVVKEFYDLPYEEQDKLVGLEPGHSGNTFGGACALARALLAGEPV